MYSGSIGTGSTGSPASRFDISTSPSAYDICEEDAGRLPGVSVYSLMPPSSMTGIPSPAARTYLPPPTCSHDPCDSLGSDDVAVTTTEPTGYASSMSCDIISGSFCSKRPSTIAVTDAAICCCCWLGSSDCIIWQMRRKLPFIFLRTESVMYSPSLVMRSAMS